VKILLRSGVKIEIVLAEDAQWVGSAIASDPPFLSVRLGCTREFRSIGGSTQECGFVGYRCGKLDPEST